MIVNRVVCVRLCGVFCVDLAWLGKHIRMQIAMNKSLCCDVSKMLTANLFFFNNHKLGATCAYLGQFKNGSFFSTAFLRRHKTDDDRKQVEILVKIN